MANIIVVRKDNKIFNESGQYGDFIKSEWKAGNKLTKIEIKGENFEVGDIKYLTDTDLSDEKDDGGFLKRKLYLENLNKKRALPEWKTLETEQYNLLKEKQKTLDNRDYEMSKSIQEALVANSDMILKIAREHGLYKPELN